MPEAEGTRLAADETGPLALCGGQPGMGRPAGFTFGPGECLPGLDLMGHVGELGTAHLVSWR